MPSPKSFKATSDVRNREEKRKKRKKKEEFPLKINLPIWTHALVGKPPAVSRSWGVLWGEPTFAVLCCSALKPHARQHPAIAAAAAAWNTASTGYRRSTALSSWHGVLPKLTSGFASPHREEISRENPPWLGFWLSPSKRRWASPYLNL